LYAFDFPLLRATDGFSSLLPLTALRGVFLRTADSFRSSGVAGGNARPPKKTAKKTVKKTAAKKTAAKKTAAKKAAKRAPAKKTAKRAARKR
jgi:hypothetical protein